MERQPPNPEEEEIDPALLEYYAQTGRNAQTIPFYIGSRAPAAPQTVMPFERVLPHPPQAPSFVYEAPTRGGAEQPSPAVFAHLRQMMNEEHRGRPVELVTDPNYYRNIAQTDPMNLLLRPEFWQLNALRRAGYRTRPGATAGPYSTSLTFRPPAEGAYTPGISDAQRDYDAYQQHRQENERQQLLGAHAGARNYPPQFFQPMINEVLEALNPGPDTPPPELEDGEATAPNTPSRGPSPEPYWPYR